MVRKRRFSFVEKALDFFERAITLACYKAHKRDTSGKDCWQCNYACRRQNK